MKVSLLFPPNFTTTKIGSIEQLTAVGMVKSAALSGRHLIQTITFTTKGFGTQFEC